MTTDNRKNDDKTTDGYEDGEPFGRVIIKFVYYTLIALTAVATATLLNAGWGATHPFITGVASVLIGFTTAVILMPVYLAAIGNPDDEENGEDAEDDAPDDKFVE